MWRLPFVCMCMRAHGFDTSIVRHLCEASNASGAAAELAPRFLSSSSPAKATLPNSPIPPFFLAPAHGLVSHS